MESVDAAPIDGEAEEEEVVVPRISQLSTPISSPSAGAAIDQNVNSHLRRLFRFPFVERISLRPPGENLRREFLRPVFFDWLEHPMENINSSRSTANRPPRP